MRSLKAVGPGFIRQDPRKCLVASAPPQNEATPFYPRSPYAVSKVAAHWYAVNFGERRTDFSFQTEFCSITNRRAGARRS